MKTITEMQAQIKEMSSKLDEFAKELSDYNKTENQREAIDFKQIKAIGVRNPIIGHILGKVDEVTKKKYITMLIAIAYMASDNQENAWLLIQRIAAGANFTEELIDLSVDAVNITDAQIDEFTLNIANEKLTNAFVVDAMLIYLSCESSNEKMLEFLAALFELVKCGKKEVHELSELAKIIIEQDSSKYIQFCFKELEFDITELFGYIKQFHQGILVCNSKFFILEYPHKTKISKDAIGKLPTVITADKIELSNIIFQDLSKDDNWFKFESCNDIILKSCEFNSSVKCITIHESKNAVINECVFKSMSNRAIHLTSCEELKISKCSFESCSYRTDDKYSYGYQSPAYGGALYLEYIKNVLVTDCKFEYCSSNHGEGGDADGAVAHLNNIDLINLSNITFKSCKSSYWRSTWRDTGTLFHIEKCLRILSENCSYVDCSIPYQIESGFKKLSY